MCDDIWDPHAVQWDGYGIPAEWDELLAVTDELLEELKDHPTYHLLIGMTKRSFRKMATVYRAQVDHHIYIQTGLAQRGLGFGWRLEERGKVELVRRYFQVMPTSLGVAVVSCPVPVAQQRNLERLDKAETAHENRQHMVPLMLPAIGILREVMSERGVSLINIDSTKPIKDARWDLLQFTIDRANEAEAARPSGEVAALPQYH